MHSRIGCTIKSVSVKFDGQNNHDLKCGSRYDNIKGAFDEHGSFSLVGDVLSIAVFCGIGNALASAMKRVQLLAGAFAIACSAAAAIRPPRSCSAAHG